MKNAFWILLLSTSSLSALKPEPKTTKPCECPEGPWGWSVDVGGQYTWMSFTKPPTYHGSTGGVVAKLSYQKPWSFYGQVRSVYNLGPLSSHHNSSNDYEWYTEVVGGYCTSLSDNWSFTPYLGFGFDFLRDHQNAYGSTSGIHLNYNIYYAIVGIDLRYAWDQWTLGIQADCLPTFDQYLKISSRPGIAWSLSERVGAAVRLPIGYEIVKNIWIELDPYYRFLPIGSSSVLDLPHRNLSQWGTFLTFKFLL